MRTVFLVFSFRLVTESGYGLIAWRLEYIYIKKARSSLGVAVKLCRWRYDHLGS